MKKMSPFPYIVAIGCIAFFIIAGMQYQQSGAATGVYSLSTSASAPTQPAGTTWSITMHVGDYTLAGPPTISAAFIDWVLAQAGSPAAGSGQALYDLGVQYGIDPVYALAFFHHESKFGTTGEARVTHSLGNLRCIADRPCIDQKRGGYALMTSWLDGFDHWYSLILNLYIKQWGRTTVETIIPKYAPNADGNNEAAYITAVEGDVLTWRAEMRGGH